MRVGIIVESRLSSRRLPGKALRDLAGAPMLARLIERLKRVRLADTICLATSDRPEDAALESLAGERGVACYSGSLDDVLARVLGAADSVAADIIVGITGDCPLADPRIIDQAIARYRIGGADYVANMLDRLSYPIGLDVQVYSRGLLAAVDALCTDPTKRAHVTPYIYLNGERFRLLGLEAPPALERPHYRLCVDEAVDLEVIGEIYRALAPGNPDFGLAEVVAFLDANPALAGRNVDLPDAFACPRTRGPVRRERLPMPDDDARLNAA